MNQEILDIQERLMAGNVPPQELAEFRVRLSGWYSHYSGEMEEILARRPAMWRAIRASSECKSDKSADRIYEGLEDGIKLMRLEIWLKSMGKMNSAISGLLELKSNESRNNY